MVIAEQDVSTGCVARIRAHFGRLTKTERKVADYVLANESVVYLTILELAAACEVGYGTVARFCKQVGYSGFQDMKISLAEDLSRRRTEQEMGRTAETKRGIAAVAHAALEDIRATEQLLSDAVVEGVARTLLGARSILVCGVSSSAATVQEVEYRLARFGLPVCGVVDNHMQRIRAASLGPEDVAFLISFSGSTLESLATGEIAQQAGARIVTLTNFYESPVSKLADYALVTGIHLDPLSAEVPSRVAIAFVLTVLFGRVAELQPDTKKALTRTFRATADRQL